MLKENEEHESKKSERMSLKIEDGADSVLKNFRIPSKGVYEYPKLFKEQEKEAEKFNRPPKYGLKIMPISKRFYLMSEVVDL